MKRDFILSEWEYENEVTEEFFKDHEAAYDVLVEEGDGYVQNDDGAWYVIENKDCTYTVQGDEGAKTFEPQDVEVANPMDAVILYQLSYKFKRVFK